MYNLLWEGTMLILHLLNSISCEAHAIFITPLKIFQKNGVSEMTPLAHFRQLSQAQENCAHAPVCVN